MKKTNVSPWNRLIMLLNLDKAEVTQLYIHAIFSGLISLSLPLGIQSVTHFIQGGKITTSWIVLVFLVVAAVILTGVLQIMQLRITETIQQKIFIRHSFDFAYRFPRFKRKILKTENSDELMNRFFDIISLQKGISKILLNLFPAILQLIFSLIVLSFYHSFFIFFSIMLITVLTLILRPIIQKGFQTSLTESGNKYKTAYWLQEVARSNWSFRLLPNDNHAFNQLDNHASNYIKSRESHFKVLWTHYVLMIGFKVAIVASLLALGGYLVIDQQMNLGQFVAAEALILLILSAFEKIIELLETLYDVFTSMEKISQVEELPTSFKYKVTEVIPEEVFPLQIVEISNPAKIIFSVESSEKVFLKASNPNQASKLMASLIEENVSENYAIKWNKKTPNAEQLAGWYKYVGWFDSSLHLFNGKIRDNISLGNPNITEQQIIKTINLVGLDDILAKKLHGIDFVYSKQQYQFNKSQMEKILIARAIVNEPKLLLLNFNDMVTPQSEIQEIINKITSQLPETTIVCTGPIQINGTWRIINI